MSVPVRTARSADNHPGERLEDRGALQVWWIQHRGYRDVWMLLITALVVWSLVGIQDSRREAIRIQCIQQNERNDETVRVLDIQLSQRAGATLREVEEVSKGRLTVDAVYARHVMPLPEGGRKTRLLSGLESRQFVVFLIDALVPKRDCDERVRELIS